MGKIRVGNKQNSYLNQMWAKHGMVDGKKRANSVRRRKDKQEVLIRIQEESDKSPSNY